MIEIGGFEWYYEQHLAAPNGKFLGFLYGSIRHIYINKIWHGLRGVAWIPEREMIPTTSDYSYLHSGIDNWHIWTYGG